MKKINLSILLFCAFLIFNGCNLVEDTNPNPSNPTDNFSENFGAEVSRDFIGQVVDLNNNPLQNVTVQIGTSTAQTDVNGVFIINGAMVHQQFAFIIVKKAGFIDGSRSMVPTTGQNNLKIMLVPSTPIATVSTGVVAEVELPSGTKVVFDGAFQDANGNAYSGDVSVSMFHLEASDENLSSLMPGMLYGESETGEEAGLQTFGMLNVELRGSAGQKLQIANGHTADIEMMIDFSQLATAPASIPLWHFDEEKGYWKQQGTANKVGNKYIGEVSHFSWWNCDAFSSVVSLTVSVAGESGNPLPNIQVSLVLGSNPAASQITNNMGMVSGMVPANQVMTLIITDNCGNVISSSSIGPFASDMILPIVITPAMAQFTTVTGTLLQCDNSNVTNGYISMQYGGGFVAMPVTAGAFSFSNIVCTGVTEFVLEGFDYTNQQGSGNISYTYTGVTTNVGSIPVCNGYTEFISYSNVGGPLYQYTSNFTAVVNADGKFEISVQNGANTFQIGNTSGFIYNTPNTYEYPLIGGAGLEDYFEGPSNITLTVTNVGAVGEYIDFTFGGSWETTGEQSYYLTGVGHVIRDN